MNQTFLLKFNQNHYLVYAVNINFMAVYSHCLSTIVCLYVIYFS